MNVIDEYRRSLKMPAAEELFDLLFYRPLAFIFVKGIYRLPVTPNQVTILSMLSGLVAAWYLALGVHSALIAAGVWYAVANILDCADGQLARLQKSGTPLGRLVDGIADYISSVAIFIGIGIGIAMQGEQQWLIVVLAAISSAIHAMVFDHYQSEYISIVRGEKNFTGTEKDNTLSKLREAESSAATIRTLALKVYLRYLTLQQNAGAASQGKQFSPDNYRLHNTNMIRLWSVLGPTTNRTLLIVSALAGNIDIFLWGVIMVGNLWLLICYILQSRVYQRMASADQNLTVIRDGTV